MLILKWSISVKNWLILVLDFAKKKWSILVKSIVKEYNEKNVHRTTGYPPAKVSKKNEKEIYERVYPINEFQLQKPTFKVGDCVQITRKKDIFGNKYLRTWTTEIFVVSKIHFTDPITYSIKALDGEEILGHFYKYELQKTKF